jgi:HlyD family secretion protein
MDKVKLNHIVISLIAGGTLMFTAGCTRSGPQNVMASDKSDHPIAHPNVVLACPGRTEGRTEAVQVGAAADGIVKQVFVKEGDHVWRGAKLAQIDCQDVEASLMSVKAEVESARQVKLRLERGSREEERLAAEQRTIAAKAVLDESASRLKRMTELRASKVVAATDFDSAQRDYDVAEAKLKEARRNEEFVNAHALREEIEKADADIRAADFRVVALREKMSKCDVTAPMDGTILRVLIKPGEAYSTMAPQPLFTLSDLSVRRIRAEVDERDVMKVRAGQQVLVSTEADQDDRYTGVVESISRTMGRKHTQTGDPSEKSDRDVLETLVRLKNGADLPVGMRVIVKFEAFDKDRSER